MFCATCSQWIRRVRSFILKQKLAFLFTQKNDNVYAQFMIYESVRELFKYGKAIQHHAFFKFSAQNVGPPNLPNKYKLLHVYFKVQKCTSFLQRLHM